MSFFQPSSVDEATALIASSTPPWESPTTVRHRSTLHLDDAFGDVRRRPEWVWAAGTPSRPLGLVAGLGKGDELFVLDVFSPPSDASLAEDLIAHATAQARSQFADGPEASVYAPTDLGVDDPLLSSVVRPLRAAGWDLLVERRHYEFAPYDGLSTLPTDLTFSVVDDAADPRLVACHRDIMRGTLDVHDAALIAKVGFEQACVESLDYLVTTDPVDCIKLASDPSGDVVGMISSLLTPTLRGFVLFAGVAEQHRGHGYARQMTAWITRDLVAAGAEVLIADTDNTNSPMAAAFAGIGWPQTETRIDLVLPR